MATAGSRLGGDNNNNSKKEEEKKDPSEDKEGEEKGETKTSDFIQTPPLKYSGSQIQNTIAESC